MHSGRMRDDSRSIARSEWVGPGPSPARRMSFSLICRRLGLTLSAGILIGLGSFPLRGIAQTAASPQTEPPPSVEVQPLSETKTEIPITPPSEQAGNASTGA